MTRIPVTGGKDASILIRVVMSPADTYAAALVCLLVIYFLCRICQPRYHDSDGTLNIMMTQETRNFKFNFLGLSELGPPASGHCLQPPTGRCRPHGTPERHPHHVHPGFKFKFHSGWGQAALVPWLPADAAPGPGRVSEPRVQVVQVI
jgi:hypothetical protein